MRAKKLFPELTFKRLWNKITGVENKFNSLIESGVMTLSGSEHCTITDFTGNYYKIGKLVHVRFEFKIEGDGMGGDNAGMYVHCLPYATKAHNIFSAYASAILKEPTSGTYFTSVGAGAYGSSKSIYLNGFLFGRTWHLHGNNVETKGGIVITGTYETA